MSVVESFFHIFSKTDFCT